MTDITGSYSVTVPEGFSGTATPSLFGFEFTPPSRTINVTSDMLAEDFTAIPLNLITVFSGGLGGFIIDNAAGDGGGLWHLTTACESATLGHTTPTSLYFGQDSTCNFDTGSTAEGTATSPVISVFTGDTVILRFNYFLEGEGGGNYDVATVSVAVDGGPFQEVARNSSGALLDGTGVWEAAVIDLAPLLTAKTVSADIEVQFAFDSGDPTFNLGAGFYVDDVEIVVVGAKVSFTSSPFTTAFVGEEYTYNITAVDPNSGGILTITAPRLPNWLTLTDHGDGTATLSGTPDVFDKEDSDVELRVENLALDADTQAFEIELLRYANVLTNPSFETGDFTGWTTSDPVDSGLHVAGVSRRPIPFGPTDGTFHAFHNFEGNEPGTISIWQQVTLPAPTTTLLFDYRASWDITVGTPTQDRTFAVNILPGGVKGPLIPLQTDLILTAVAGENVPDTDPLTGMVDLSPFAGQTVVISFNWFVPESLTGPAAFTLDNLRLSPAQDISLPVSRPWTSALIALVVSLVGVAVLSGAAMSSRRRIVARSSHPRHTHK